VPFTSAPSHVFRPDARAAQIEAAAKDDSADARAHLHPALKRPCPRPDCAAVINQRCIASRRPKTFSLEPHPERAALTQPERKITMTTIATEKTAQPAAKRSKSAATRSADKIAADAKKTANPASAADPKPAASKPAPAPKPPELPADKLTRAEKAELTPNLLAAISQIVRDADPKRRPLVARHLTDTVCRYLPSFAEHAANYPDLPAATPFKSKS
jgi:hypothetical protein